jgi:hypothetical protein
VGRRSRSQQPLAAASSPSCSPRSTWHGEQTRRRSGRRCRRLCAEEDPTTFGEGAAIVALGVAPIVSAETGVVLAGWAIEPLRREDVARRALASAGIDNDAAMLRLTAPSRPATSAVAGVLAFGRACRAISDRAATLALVVEVGPLATTACVLVAASRGAA